MSDGGGSLRAQRRGPSRRAWLSVGAALLVLGALAAAWRYTPLSDFLTATNIRAWARAARGTPWAPFAMVAAYTPAAFVMFPRPVLTFVAVIAFGAWLGFAYAITGILLASFVAYSLGRMLRPERAERLAGRHLPRVRKALEKHGLLAVFVMRIVPTAPDVVESILAGAMRVRAWHFALGTLLGMLPGVLAMTVFSGQIARWIEEPSEASYVIAGAALVAIAALAWFAHRWAAKH